MNQSYVIETLVDWLRKNLVDESLEILCDHVTERRQELGLYLGAKQAGKGMGSRIAQADIVIIDPRDRKIRLVVEVEPSSNPKKLLGDILAVLLADNYTPSNKYHGDHFQFDDCLVVFLTELKDNPNTQKHRQFELIEKAISEKLDLKNFGVKATRLCYGVNDEDSVDRCRRLLKQYFDMRSGDAISGADKIGSGSDSST